MPGLAVGSTTRAAVCQRLAPSASEAAVRCCGHARERVLGDREDDRDHREAHREADHQAVALVVGEARAPRRASAGSRRRRARSRSRPEPRPPPRAAEQQQRHDQRRSPCRACSAARKPCGSRSQSSTPARAEHRQRARSSGAPATRWRSTRDASHSPAMKPITTLGSAAMISTVGLTFALMRRVHELRGVERAEDRQRHREEHARRASP